MAYARTVIEEEVVRRTIDAASKKFERLKSIFEGCKWVLAREPRAGVLIGGREYAVYALRSQPPDAAFPAIVLYYRYDEETVTILNVRIYPPLTVVSD
jgi:hypothetical protein